MGNNQSQDSDDENRQTQYTYHESVLRDAQQLSIPDGYQSDDQYFSAEEGDSDRSITPERTRPESSSGEDSSADSGSENEEVKVDSGEISLTSAREIEVTHTASPAKKRKLLSASARDWTVKKSCGHCNVSRFQEHDSIGPELDTSHWDANHSNVTVHTTRQSQRSSGQISNCKKDSGQGQGDEVLSPFMPINSPPSVHNASQTYASNLNNKRKASCSLNNSTSPKRKTLAISPNKRRFGMLDESDTDSDVEKIVKKPRVKSRGLPLGQGETGNSPSATEDIGINLTTRTGKNDNEDGPVDEGENDDSSPVIKIRKTEGESRYKNKNGVKRKNDGTEFEGETNFPTYSEVVEKQNSSKELVKNKAVTELSYDGVSSSLPSDPGIRMSTRGAFLPLKSRNPAVIVSRCDEEVQKYTVKMGNNAVRNSQGKVLPVRQGHHHPAPSSSSDAILVSCTSLPASQSVQTSHSDSSLEKSSSKLQLRKLKVLRPQGLTQTVDESSNCNNSSAVEIFEHQGNQEPKLKELESNVVKEDTNKSSANAVEGNGCDEGSPRSPFHNVVLTPPSCQTAVTNSRTESHGLKRCSSDMSSRYAAKTVCTSSEEKRQEAEPMETDESLMSTTSDPFSHHPVSQRLVTRAKRSSAAERFKTFLSAGNLKSNLKTLFFKNNKKEEHQSNSPNQSNWSLYSSSSNLFGQSPFSTQSARNFQSTSSPISTVGLSSVPDVESFSPISHNVTATSSFTNTSTTSLQKKRQSPSLAGKKGSLRKAVSANQLPTRTSSRLRSSKRLSNINANISSANASNSSNNSSGSFESVHNSSDIQQLPQTSQFQVLHYRLCQTLEISLAMGNIAEEMSSGIVNWTDGSLSHAATVPSRRICERAGALMRAACNNYLESKGGVLEPPDVLTTPAGGSFPRNVQALLHVASPSVSSQRLAACLLEVNANCLRFANERLGLDSLSMPLIGEGELPIQLCASAFIDAVLIFVTEKKEPSSPASPSQSFSDSGFALTSIRLVTEDAINTDQAASVLQTRIDQVRSSGLHCVVAGIQEQYYTMQDFSPARGGNTGEENTDRMRSGRPRLKRPRL